LPRASAVSRASESAGRPPPATRTEEKHENLTHRTRRHGRPHGEESPGRWARPADPPRELPLPSPRRRGGEAHRFADRSRKRGGRRDPHARSEEHTSELQSRFDLVCRLLLEKKKSSYCRTLLLLL